MPRPDKEELPRRRHDAASERNQCRRALRETCPPRCSLQGIGPETVSRRCALCVCRDRLAQYGPGMGGTDMALTSEHAYKRMKGLDSDSPGDTGRATQICQGRGHVRQAGLSTSFRNIGSLPKWVRRRPGSAPGLPRTAVRVGGFSLELVWTAVEPFRPGRNQKSLLHWTVQQLPKKSSMRQQVLR